jgi:beta-phosphoglucomutase
MPPIRAVIFDLDGVIVSTDEFHYQSWQRLADAEGIYFDRDINEWLRGVSRMESLAILLERAPRQYSTEEKEAIADRKNIYYKDFIQTLTPSDVLPGTLAILSGLKAVGVKVAIGSSSKNALTLLQLIGLVRTFDAIACGTDISRTKPDPEVFLVAAHRLGIPSAECLVVEDAVAGVEAALNGNMRVLAVGSAAGDARATECATDLASISLDKLLSIGMKKAKLTKS